MDTSSPAAIARALLPKVPLLFKTAVWHSLWLSPTSTKWDLKTELIVRMIRSLLDSPHPTPISKQQKWSLRDPGIKGKMWISKVTIPVSDRDDVLKLLVKAVDDLKVEGEEYTIPSITPVEAEWTGYRSNVDSHRPRLDLSEAQHYQRLLSEVSSPVTLLYFHGGAHFLMDPCTHRGITSHLAHLTHGRVFNVRYRLAPQNAFPSALLDALIAYVSLLYPPPGSFHDAVLASQIVLAGDSAGGNISLALVQLLLQINRSSSEEITYHNHTITLPLPLPAGCATQSPWVDMTRSMPSITANAHFDYLPPPLTRDKASHFPHCEVWPTDPPRGDLYCETSMLCHPLVSPLAVKDWSGSCPLWFCYGEEMQADEIQILASRAVSQGVKVVSEQWEAMPHCSALIFLGSPMSKQSYADWALFCNGVVKGEEVETKGWFFEIKTARRREIDLGRLHVLGEKEVRERMEEAREARHLEKEGEAKLLPKL